MKTQVNNAIANYIENCSNMEITTISCQCGSLTMSAFESSESICFLATNAPYIKPTFEGVNDNCNRCTNNWAVDKIDHSVILEELQSELDELEEIEEITTDEIDRSIWLKGEIERLETEQEES